MPSTNGSGDAVLGVPAMPWTAGKAAVPTGSDNAGLDNGRDVMRVWRSTGAT